MKPHRVIEGLRLAVWVVVIAAGVAACTFRPTPTRNPTLTPSPTRNLQVTLYIQSTRTQSAAMTQTADMLATQIAEQLVLLQSTPSATLAPSASPAPTEVPNPLACLPPDAAAGDTGEIGLVSWVQDGETIVVDFQGRRGSVRLIGLDAPPIAARKLRQLLENQVVRVFQDPSGEFENDARGVSLGYVLTADNSFINFEMLRQGEARLDPESRGYACEAIFTAAQAGAKTAAIGVWGVQAAEALTTRTPVPTQPPSTVVALAPSATLNPAPTAPTATLAPGQTPIITFVAPPQPPATLAPGVTPSPSPTNTPRTVVPTTAVVTTVPPPSSPTATPSGEGESDIDVEIYNIYWSGTISKNESDEYVELHNRGTTAFNLSGWSVYSDDTGDEAFIPAGFSLAAGAFCRIYTNEIHSDSCGQAKFNTPQGVWPNEYLSCGELLNPDPENIDNITYYCYDPAPE